MEECRAVITPDREDLTSALDHRHAFLGSRVRRRKVSSSSIHDLIPGQRNEIREIRIMGGVRWLMCREASRAVGEESDP
jgi:hypothetical protein